jgi:hypothetical protein
VQHPFSISIREYCSLSCQFKGGLKQPLDVDERHHDVISSYIPEKLHKKLNELVHLNVAVQNFTLVENYNKKEGG